MVKLPIPTLMNEPHFTFRANNTNKQTSFITTFTFFFSKLLLFDNILEFHFIIFVDSLNNISFLQIKTNLLKHFFPKRLSANFLLVLILNVTLKTKL